MKIHSSSLALTPARFNSQQTNKTEKTNETPQTKEKVTSTPSQDVQLPRRTYPVDKVASTTETSLVRQENAYQAVDKRTMNALNAYQQESRQTPQNQRVDSLTGLDTYV